MSGRAHGAEVAWEHDPAAGLVLPFRLLTGLLRNLDDAVLVQDTGGTVIFVNEAAARLCGLASPAEMRPATMSISA